MQQHLPGGRALGTGRGTAFASSSSNSSSWMRWSNDGRGTGSVGPGNRWLSDSPKVSVTERPPVAPPAGASTATATTSLAAGSGSAPGTGGGPSGQPSARVQAAHRFPGAMGNRGGLLAPFSLASSVWKEQGVRGFYRGYFAAIA